MRKTNKLLFALVIFIIVIAVILVVLKFNQSSDDVVQSTPCVWIYKTNEDYSNLRMGGLWFNLDKNKTSVSVIDSEPHARPEVDGGYLVSMGTCDSERAKSIVFFKEDFDYQENIEDYVIMNPFSELWVCPEKLEIPYVKVALFPDEDREKYDEIIESNRLSQFCTQIDVSETIIPEG